MKENQKMVCKSDGIVLKCTKVERKKEKGIDVDISYGFAYLTALGNLPLKKPFMLSKSEFDEW
jgi:hypothetical protein